MAPCTIPVFTDACAYSAATSFPIGGSTTRAQHCLARQSGGKRAAAHKAEALASPRHVPDDELGSREHTGKASPDSPTDDPELVVALQMAKQAAQAQLRPHRRPQLEEEARPQATPPSPSPP